MRYPCTITHLTDGRWGARADDAIVGTIEVKAADRDEALRKLRAEIQYRLEYCPCSGVGDDYVDLDVRSSD